MDPVMTVLFSVMGLAMAVAGVGIFVLPLSTFLDNDRLGDIGFMSILAGMGVTIIGIGLTVVYAFASGQA